MSLPRSYQFIALRRLTVNGVRQSRNLHMTGPATFPSPILTRVERPANNFPTDMAGLRAECKIRRLDTAGTKHDLMNRLNADELTHSRAFTTAVNAATKRPTTESVEQSKSTRHFNTSRALKSPKDSSTIDFAFLPDFGFETAAPNANMPRINFNFDEKRTTLQDAPEPVVMKPEIVVMSIDGGSTLSPMADVHDNTSMPIDFHAVADSVSVATAKIVDQGKAATEPIVEKMPQAGTMRQLWNGIVEDVMGTGKNATA